MKTESKTPFLLTCAMLFISTLAFLGCSSDKDDPIPDVYDDGINWNGSGSGTIELANNSSKDMILFVGQTPAPSNMLGGVRAGATVTHDISGQVSDFTVGGYAILRGITKDEYDKNAANPANAKIDLTIMVTYKAGTKYRYNIDRSYIGDNGFRIVNRGRIGMELRKDSPDGEKVAYLPAFQQNSIVYTQTTTAVTLFPVYVYYNQTTGEVSTLRSTSLFESVTAAPRPASSGEMNTYYLPNNASLTWAAIVGTLKQPVAYVRVVCNIVNQAGYVTSSLSKRLISQNGYDAVSAGENLVFEVQSTEEGTGINLSIVFYGGNVIIPVRFEDQTTPSPIIKNGYNYTVEVNFTGDEDADLENVNNYKATIVEGNKRDISDQITSL